MSRKFDRSAQIARRANEIMRDPRFLSRIFKPKPRWMPKFVWKIVVGLVIVQ